MCELIFPLLLNKFDYVDKDKGIRLIITLLVMALVVFMHRSNIIRIMNGNENKFSFKKTKKKQTESSDNEEAKEKEKNK